MSDDSDASLVARMAAGDQGALSALYDRHRGVVFALAQRVVRDRAEAEEILTDVFLQAWRGAAGYEPSRGSVPAWLIVLCRSRAIDRLRARGRKETVLTALAREPAASAATPDPPVDVLARRRIVAALGTLAPPQRDAIDLAYYGGMSHTEIAERLGEPLGTVKTRIRQALITLRERLGRNFDAM